MRLLKEFINTAEEVHFLQPRDAEEIARAIMADVSLSPPLSPEEMTVLTELAQQRSEEHGSR